MQQEQIRLRLTLNRKIVLRFEVIICMANLGVLVIYCLYFHSSTLSSFTLVVV